MTRFKRPFKPFTMTTTTAKLRTDRAKRRAMIRELIASLFSNPTTPTTQKL